MTEENEDDKKTVGKGPPESGAKKSAHPRPLYAQKLWIDGREVAASAPAPSRPPRAAKQTGNLNPERFAGPKLKVERAKCHIRDLEATFKTFGTENPYTLFVEVDPQTRENVFRVRVKEALPVKISAIVGDIVHNLRAALDHLVCDLIRSAKGKPDGESGFPITTKRKTLKPGRVSKIKGVSPHAERFIFRLKPYCAGNPNPVLWKLHMLDVRDKHAGIILVAAASAQVTKATLLPVSIGPGGGFAIGGVPPGWQPLAGPAVAPEGSGTVYPVIDNVEIYRSAPGLKEYVETTIHIAFAQGQVCEGEPVIETLKQFADLVERILGVAERTRL